MFDLAPELGDLVDVVAGLLAEKLNVVGLVLREIVEQTNRVSLEVLQRLSVLVHTDDKAFGLHRDWRHVTANIKVTLTLRSRSQTVDRAVDTVPWFNSNAGHRVGFLLVSQAVLLFPLFFCPTTAP